MANLPTNTKRGCTERRLCIRVARASYTDTPKEDPAITTAQTAMTVLAFTSNPPIEETSATADRLILVDGNQVQLAYESARLAP